MISNTWSEMDREVQNGFFKKLLPFENQVFYVYATLRNPGHQYGIAIAFDRNIKIDLSSFKNLRELEILFLPDNTFGDKNVLYVTLCEAQNRDVFAVLCNDLLSKIINQKDNNKVLYIIKNQLEKWRNLFDIINAGGLSPSEQMGLYGELSFLHKFLLKCSSYQSILEFWVGGDREVRDFQYCNWGVEVKTTSTNNHQRINISNERQLDNSNLEYLFLYHLSIDIIKGNSNTLNAKIAEIRNLLKNDMVSKSLFNRKLIEYGYLDIHVPFYEERGFLKRNEDYYLVKDEFPRIMENELRKGVGDIKYSIILSNCEKYMITEYELFKIINQ